MNLPDKYKNHNSFWVNFNNRFPGFIRLYVDNSGRLFLEPRYDNLYTLVRNYWLHTVCDVAGHGAFENCNKYPELYALWEKAITEPDFEAFLIMANEHEQDQ